jgi:peptidoglycan-N-acetylglucosamine deacetylase
MQSATQLKRVIKGAFSLVHLPVHKESRALLTFDDGPNPRATPAVLDLLKKHNARAIFFVIGSRIRLAPELLARIVKEGHCIGNHSYSHQKQLPFFSYIQDLSQCQNIITSATGVVPRFFRPPLGHFSPTTIIAPRLLGLKSVLWSRDALDWSLRDRCEAEFASAKLLGTVDLVRKLNDIFLFHDDHDYVESVLEPLLQRLSAVGCNMHAALDAIS